MQATRLILTVTEPADIILKTKGVVWARDNKGLLYSYPHYSYHTDLLKFPNPPLRLYIYSTGIIKDYKVLPFDPRRRDV